MVKPLILLVKCYLYILPICLCEGTRQTKEPGVDWYQHTGVYLIMYLARCPDNCKCRYCQQRFGFSLESTKNHAELADHKLHRCSSAKRNPSSKSSVETCWNIRKGFSWFGRTATASALLNQWRTSPKDCQLNLALSKTSIIVDADKEESENW